MSHLISLDHEWALWRWVLVRGAGFPADLVAALGSAALWDAADAALQAEADATGPSAAREAFAARFDRTLEEVDLKLCDLASLPRFREALAWQNREALRGPIASFTRRQGRGHDAPRRRALIGSYAQRYATKCDTIGFFGPVGWGTLRSFSQALTQRSGAGLLAARTVYLERWVVVELARQLSDRPDVRSWMAPRLHPAARVEGGVLHGPGHLEEALSTHLADAVALSDGTRAARDIAAEIGQGSAARAAEVLEGLARLAERGAILWSIEIPVATRHPERALREGLQRVGDPILRQECLSLLTAVEQRRDAVAGAAGDADRVGDALSSLQDELARQSGVDAARRGGEMYAGRGPAYEDCRRDHEVALGSPFLERLSSPLRLVLRSARWFSAEVTARYHGALGQAWRELQGTAAGPMALPRFWERFERHTGGSFSRPARVPALVLEVVEELRSRWQHLLGSFEGHRRLQVCSADLAPRARQLFPVSGPAAALFRYHSPDLMLIVDGKGEIASLVLGELHAGHNTIAVPVWLAQHPDPDALLRARELDLPQRDVFPLVSQNVLHRASFVSLKDQDLLVEMADSPSHFPRERTLRWADLVVDEVEGRMQVRTRDGRISIAALDFFSYHALAASTNLFSPIPLAPHTPRIVIDDLVVARERWILEGAQLEFARASTPQARFLEARRLARAHGIPRRIFVKAPQEPKPFYADLGSPIYVEILARVARRSARLVVTEMLPLPEDAWLEDADGTRYLSELRLVAVDRGPVEPPGASPPGQVSES